MGHLSVCPLSWQHPPRRASRSSSHSGWCHGGCRSDPGGHPLAYCRCHTERENKVVVTVPVNLRGGSALGHTAFPPQTEGCDLVIIWTQRLTDTVCAGIGVCSGGHWRVHLQLLVGRPGQCTGHCRCSQNLGEKGTGNSFSFPVSGTGCLYNEPLHTLAPGSSQLSEVTEYY